MIFAPLDRSVRFWVEMGPAFASRQVRRELPYVMDDGQTWFVMPGVGFAAVSMTNELQHCYVFPEHRGRGHARRLTRSRLDWIGSHGARTLAVDRWAAVLVGEFGFQEIGRKGKYVRLERPSDGRG